ncbi:MAG: IS630 family transposase [Gemmatimonadales bacterium]
MWCIADLNAEYIRKMEDVLALYERPYTASEPVVCLDEKPVSLHAEVRPPRPARPGHLAKRDNEYRRCGTANLFAIVEPTAGRHFTHATPNRSAAQFARAVERLVTAYPRARTIHLVMDNLNIHCEKSLTDHFGQRRGRRLWRRLAVHFTPKHGSWLNQAEIELSLVSRGCVGRRRIATLNELRATTGAWTRRANRARTRICWQFTRKAARLKFGYQKKPSTRSRT